MASVLAPAAAAPHAVAARRSAPRRTVVAGAPLPTHARRQATLQASRRAVVVRAAAEEAPSQGSDPKTMTVSLPSVLNIDEIMNRLPHRFPFLLVRWRAWDQRLEILHWQWGRPIQTDERCTVSSMMFG